MANRNDHETDNSGLQFEFDAPPEIGQPMPVAPGVYWIRMPLPFALTHINLWVLKDTSGWAAVDTGVCNEETAAVWRKLFASLASSGSLTRIFVTHMHPDHVGMAGWLTRKFAVRLWMSRLEYLSCRVTVSYTGREAPEDALRFYRMAGWSEGAIETYLSRFGNFGKHIHALPDSFVGLYDGQELQIGANTWKVIVGSGHSPEHACFSSPELKIFISGDQILPKISSNVSVQPMEPNANPMHDWLASLDKLKREVPDDVLVLPSHNECFRGLHSRIDALKKSQEQSIERLRHGLTVPKRVLDVFPLLFSRPIGEEGSPQLGMATGEAVACLNYLMHRREVVREVDGHGISWYRFSS